MYLLIACLKFLMIPGDLQEPQNRPLPKRKGQHALSNSLRSSTIESSGELLSLIAIPFKKLLPLGFLKVNEQTNQKNNTLQPPPAISGEEHSPHSHSDHETTNRKSQPNLKRLILQIPCLVLASSRFSVGSRLRTICSQIPSAGKYSVRDCY